MPPKTRHQSGDINPDVEFPVLDQFQRPTQLPTYKSVIGVLQSLTAGGKVNRSHDEAVREVAKQLYAKWFHDTVYCLALNTIQDAGLQIYSIFVKLVYFVPLLRISETSASGNLLPG